MGDDGRYDTCATKRLKWKRVDKNQSMLPFFHSKERYARPKSEYILLNFPCKMHTSHIGSFAFMSTTTTLTRSTTSLKPTRDRHFV